MPTYRYRCEKDGEEFEVWQSIHDDALTRHPGCGGKVAKVLAPAGIVLKGSGFYRTDSRAGSRKSGPGESKESKGKEPSKEPSGNGSGDAESPSGSKDSTGPKNESKGATESKPSKSGRSST